MLADGAMGTMLYARGIPFDRCFDEINLSDPERVAGIHRDYLTAGAELIETNTFGANRRKLAGQFLEDELERINSTGVKLARDAREVTGRDVFIAGSIGPVGEQVTTRVRRELKVAPGGEPLKAGDQILVGGVFNDGDRIDVIGISRGKGFQGVMKRHNFAGGAATHGSMFHRAPGSIGASSFPSRVVRGMRMAGHMGADRVTTRNLKVLRVDAENNLLLVEGAVPGGTNSVVLIRKAVAAKKIKVAQVEPVKKKGKK